MLRGRVEARPSSGGARAATAAAQPGGRGIARFRGWPLPGAAADGESQFRGHLGAEGLPSECVVKCSPMHASTGACVARMCLTSEG